VDPDQRRKAYSAAPIFTQTTIYGFPKQFDFMPYSDELPGFFLSRWK
jgi:hypothetical protein